MRRDRLSDARREPGGRSITGPQRQRCLFVCTALLTASWAATAAAVCYVDGAAGGANTGATWGDAYTDLQSALTNAACAEVWVAEGIYTPAASDVSAHFAIAPGVAVFGGFSGSETSRDGRDPAAHATVLSGAISGGNSQHIVVLDGTGAGNPVTAATVLDGFTLSGGKNTNGQGGGALWCRGNGAGHACSPTLANLVLSGNTAGSGGAMEFDAYQGGVSNPTLTNVTFSGNSATLFGGAMYNNAQLGGGVGNPTLTNVKFVGNSSGAYGGAMVNDGTGAATSSPTLTNVTFSGNNAVTGGGAIFNNGGGGTSSPTLTNVTFYGNTTAGKGGAMYNSGTSGTSSPKVINATFSGNSAESGGAIYNAGAYGGLLLNSILWGDTATNGAEFFSNNGYTSLYYSIVEGGCTVDCGGSSNSTGDPKLGALADNGGFAFTMMPGPGSAAIDAVPCGYASEAPLTDQRGAARPDRLSAGATRCDVGAVEVGSLPGDLVFADKFGSSPWDDF